MTVQQELSDEFDKQLHSIIKNGVPLTDKDGNAVLDELSRPLYAPAPAAYFAAARGRLKDCNMTKVVTDGDNLDQIRKQLAAGGTKVFKLPALSDQDDAATA